MSSSEISVAHGDFCCFSHLYFDICWKDIGQIQFRSLRSITYRGGKTEELVVMSGARVD